MKPFVLLYLLQKITLLEKKQQNACTEYFLYISLHRFRDKTRTRSLMDRALGYGPRGCGFDSRRVHQNPLKVTLQGIFFSNKSLDFRDQHVGKYAK